MGLSFVTGAAGSRAQALEICLARLSAFSVTDVGYPWAEKKSIRGPDCHMSIKTTFTCRSDNLVYAITCHSCNFVYVGEVSRSLAVRFSEHLADIRHNRSKPVAQHFNFAGHTIADVRVKGAW